MVGPALGPVLGGIIVDRYSWPLIFYINLPIGIAAFFMTLAFIKDQTYVKRSTNPIDWVGLGLLTAGVAGLQFVLERGQREDWFSSQTIDVAAAISICSLVAFVIRELRDPQPLVDLSVFKTRSFAAGNVIGIVSGFGLYGTALIMPLYFQNVMGFDATTTGYALLPGAIATAVSMPLASRFLKYVDQRVSIALGLFIFALGCWLMGGLNMQAAFEDTLLPRCLQGFALGFLFVPLTTATLSEISRAKMSNATGVYTLVRQLGGSLGIAILQLIETRREDSAYATLASGITMANHGVANLLHGASNQTAALNNIFSLVMLNAETVAYNDVFRICALVFLVAMPSVFLLRGQPAESTGGPPVVVE
jgi:DHA2 family multidrug resistance protein